MVGPWPSALAFFYHYLAIFRARPQPGPHDAIQVDSCTLQEFAVTTAKRKVAKESADMALAA
jgi:hypothetical protein